MTLFIFLVGILLLHWFADFVLQTDKQAKGKSSDLIQLLSHTFTYSLVWLIASELLIIAGILPMIFIWFAVVTFLFHTITDYYTSKLNSKLWAKGDVHNFFVSVGFDQTLHYIQLFGTFFLLVALCK